MDDESGRTVATVVAALEHMTGPSRGSVTWLDASAVDVSLDSGRSLHVTEAQPGKDRADLVARLHRAGDSYEIEAPEGRDLWVNGERVTARELRHCDMIEFGQAGPLSRFRLYGTGPSGRKTITDIMCDCVDYLRVSRRPAASRFSHAFGALLRQLTRETTILFRITVLIVLGVFIGLAYQQYRFNIQLQESIATGAARIESIAAAVSRASDEALRPSDLAALREEIGERVISNVERLEALERRSKAAARVIAESMPAVAFLQGSYGFREPETGRMLRHVVSAEGVPLISPRGQPLLTLEGDGPVAEIQVIGTGFLVGEEGALVTNRHVALPWESDASAASPPPDELEPVMTRFIAYLPGRATAFDLTLRQVSDESDLAVLGLVDPDRVVTGLVLADAAPAAGDEVIVMGYPTGLRSMLAQSGAAFIEALQAAEETGFWAVAARLAAEGLIAPLASRGIVGHTTPETIVYDAETTHGGSGGPVLDMEGRVVAVNTAILPEYGGSNLGVPAAKVRELLEQPGL